MLRLLIRSLTWILLLLPFSLQSQNTASHGVDTTDTGYQIGYQIGSWLPFLIIITLVLMVMYRARKLSKD